MPIKPRVVAAVIAHRLPGERRQRARRSIPPALLAGWTLNWARGDLLCPLMSAAQTLTFPVACGSSHMDDDDDNPLSPFRSNCGCSLPFAVVLYDDDYERRRKPDG